MKTFAQHILEDIETVDLGFEEVMIEIFDKTFNSISEESTSASTSTGGVANSDSSPLGRKSKFMGHTAVEVDDETYSNMIQGKTPFKRWAKYVGDDALRDEMRKMYQKNKKLLIKNSRTGGMVFVK